MTRKRLRLLSARRPGSATPDDHHRYARGKHLSAKVRSFIDFMAEHFKAMDYERKRTARLA